LHDVLGRAILLSMDLDVHGVVSLRVVGGDRQDLRRRAPHVDAVAVRPDDGRDPDVVVRFVDALVTDGPLRRLGRELMADDSGVILLLPNQGRVRVRISGASPWELVCERRVGEVPLLLAIIRLSALARGVVSFHATAFAYGQRGVVATGWGRSGKTAALLAALAHGATFVASECVFLGVDGRLVGLPQPTKIKPSHLGASPAVDALVRDAASRHLRRATGHRFARRAATALADTGPAGVVAGRAASVLERRAAVDVDLRGRAEPVPLAALLLLEDADVEGVVIESVAPDVAAVRLTSIFEEDIAALRACHRAAGFVDPSIGDGPMAALRTYRPLLERLIAPHPSFGVRYRRPIAPDALHAAMVRALES
jgi:hypothetical protein